MARGRRKNTLSNAQKGPALASENVKAMDAGTAALDAAAGAAGGDTVMVALNRTSGILFSVPGGRQVLIHGNADGLRGMEKGVLPVGAFGLTEVSASDWAYIEKTYGGMELFKNGLLFAQKSRADAQAEASEKKDTRNGLEPVDVNATATRPIEGAI